MSDIFVFGNLVEDLINGKPVLGGEGSFVAATLAILSRAYAVPVSYVLAGCVGNDASGKFLLKELQSLGVNVSQIRKATIQTFQVIVEGAGKGKFVGSNNGSACYFAKEDVVRLKPVWKSPGWIFFTGTTVRDPITQKSINTILKETPRLLFFDCNWRECFLARMGISRSQYFEKTILPYLQQATIFKGTREEMKIVEKFLQSPIEKIFSIHPKLQWIVETNGAQGARLLTRESEYFSEAQKVKEVQDTGAGDCFSGTLLYNLAQSDIKNSQDFQKISPQKIEENLAMACKVASLAVQGFGVDALKNYPIGIMQ